jgi:hypothetical protein
VLPLNRLLAAVPSRYAAHTDVPLAGFVSDLADGIAVGETVAISMNFSLNAPYLIILNLE